MPKTTLPTDADGNLVNPPHPMHNQIIGIGLAYVHTRSDGSHIFALDSSEDIDQDDCDAILTAAGFTQDWDALETRTRSWNPNSPAYPTHIHSWTHPRGDRVRVHADRDYGPCMIRHIPA